MNYAIFDYAGMFDRDYKWTYSVDEAFIVTLTTDKAVKEFLDYCHEFSLITKGIDCAGFYIWIDNATGSGFYAKLDDEYGLNLAKNKLLYW